MAERDHHENEPTLYEINTLEPESMTVGKLNKVVRALREELYQKQLKLQQQDTALESAALVFKRLAQQFSSGDSMSRRCLEAIASIDKVRADGDKNQCDGCQAKIPVNAKGYHEMKGDGDGYLDLMVCQKGKYTK